MHPKYLSIILGLILILMGSVSAINTTPIETQSRGNILYVGGSGAGNYTRIQDAIDNATSGDTVFVFNDSSPYEENIWVNKPLNLIGEDKNTTEIIGDTDDWIAPLRITANQVTLNGLHIKTQFYGPMGIDAVGWFGNNGTIRDNIIGRSESSGLSITGSNFIICNNLFKYCFSGLELDGGYECNISLNVFFNNIDGLYIVGQNNTVWKNEFIDNELGIRPGSNNNIVSNQLYNCGVQTGANCIVKNNFVNNKPLVYLDGITDMTINQSAGQVLLTGCNNITISNQNLSHASTGIYIVKSKDCMIINNTFMYNGGFWGQGVAIADCKNLSFAHNIVKKNTNGIVIWWDCEKSTFNDNVISSNSNSGMVFSYGTYNNYNLISGNEICYNGDTGISLYGSNCVITNNNISYNGDLLPIAYDEYLESGILIWYSDSMNNTIANNKIHANFVNGIMLKDAHSLDGPSYTIIHNNTITHHRKGISMRKATHTQIIYNDIRNNIRGIKIFESSSNIISHNNFMDNIQSCFFIGGSNTWDNNYWGRPRNLPKIIFGRFGSIYELIPWFNVDWHPAQEPFEIGGIV